MKKPPTSNLQPRRTNEDARSRPGRWEVGGGRWEVSALRFFAGALSAALLMTQGFLATAQPTSTPPASYSTFGKFIAERNIFNPNRRARAANTPYRPRTRTQLRRNSFGLAGMISYDEGETAGIHAFFDGTSADYRKVLQPGGTIAVFKIKDITPDSVTLWLDTNATVLKVGQQMRDDGQGHWSLSSETMNYAKNSSSDSSRTGRRGNTGERNENGGETLSENSDTNSVEGMPFPPDLMGEEGDPNADPTAETPPEPSAADVLSLPTGPGSDALRRLMELRAQEEQQTGNRN